MATTMVAVAMALVASMVWVMTMVPPMALGAMVVMATSVHLSMADTFLLAFTENMTICEGQFLPESITKLDSP